MPLRRNPASDLVIGWWHWLLDTTVSWAVAMTAGLGSVQHTGLARLQRHNLAVKAELKVIAPKVITLVITQPPSLPPPTLHTDLCVNESWNSKFWQNSSNFKFINYSALQFIRITPQQLSVVAMVSIIYARYLLNASPGYESRSRPQGWDSQG